MYDVLIRAGCFVTMILLGYVLKLLGVFKKENFSVLSNIVMKLTLPAAIVVSISSYTVDVSLLTIVAIGLFGCAASIFVAWLANIRRGRERQAFAMTNVAGYNIGCFTMPFAQTFLGPVGVVTTSLFDVGNAFFVLGGGYGIASSLKNGQGFSLKPIAKALLGSVPFLTYLIMLALNLLRISLPGPILSFAELVAAANVLCAMLMLGVAFDIRIRKEQIPDVLLVILPRYLVAGILSACAYWLLPFDLEIRKALVLLLLSPMGATAPIFVEKLGSDVALASTINSICIVISLVLIVTFLTLM